MTSDSRIPLALFTHAWNVPLRKAAALQSELAEYVELTPLTGAPRLVAGVDTAYHGDDLFVAVVVIDMVEDKIVEIGRAHSRGKTLFPYMPGYLAFREAPTMLAALKRLFHRPDLVFVSGHGVCHPRLCGKASHVGLRSGLPTIGCSRERLVGHYTEPGPKTGDYSVIRYSPQAPGVVLRTREGVKPVFVSPGHGIDLLGAIEQTIRCIHRYRLPEPLRRAHIEAGRSMRSRREQSQQTED